MTRDAIKIIGLNPGTRYLGIAVFNGHELMDWRIKVLKGTRSKEKMKKAIDIISKFIDYYSPAVLAIKKLRSSRRSSNLARLVIRMKEFSRRKGIRIYQYSIKDLEKFFIPEGKANKKNLADAIVLENPVLFHELRKEKSNKNPYYGRVFEATALASACAQELGKS